jgi:hypothetical protein
MANGRCRMHGGLSTGPRTAAGRARCAAVRRTHGLYAADTIALRREANARIRGLRSLIAAVRVDCTAGHGVLPPNPAQRRGSETRRPSANRMAATPRTSSASSRLRGESSVARHTFSAGHGLLPSRSAPTPQSARPARNPAPRLGLVQRTLLGGSALGLGLTVPPPASAGPGLLSSFSGRAG